MKIYKHIKSGNYYERLGDGKMKFEGEWYPCVYYRRIDVGDVDCHTTYTRVLYSFNSSFQEVKREELEYYLMNKVMKNGK